MPTQIESGDSYRSFAINLDTGVASRGIWLCIAQLPPRSKQEIEDNAACPRNVEVLTEILQTAAGQQQPLLNQHAQPGQLPVLVCPEYAFGSEDWTRVDALVQAFSGALLVVVGFGQCSREGLDSIRASALQRGVTLRCGWNEEPEDGGRAMNFGCVWVKTPDSLREAVFFGKNFLEAQVEDLGGLFKFNQLTEIVFNDLRLLPFICADVLETPRPGAGVTVTQRLAGRIVGQHTPALCVGSLLQSSKQASEKWVNAIDRLVHEFGEAQVALVIANVASPTYDSRKGGGDWRNLSGIYVSKRKRATGQKGAQEATAYFESPALMAWLLRSTVPQLVFGTVSLPPYATDSGVLHPWNASPVRPRVEICCEQLPRIREYTRSGLQDELLLLSEVTEREVGGSTLQFKHVRNHLNAHSRDAANALVSHLFDGPLLPTPRLRSASELCKKSFAALGECLSCLDAIMEGSEKMNVAEMKSSWAPAAAAVGEVIRVGIRAIPVSLWWSIESSTGEMLTELRQRAYNRAGAVLRIFGRGRDGDIAADDWKEMCMETTTATDLPVAVGDSALPYADLTTAEATSVSHVVKPLGFQRLMKLAHVRCEKGNDEFVKGYVELVGIVQS